MKKLIIACLALATAMLYAADDGKPQLTDEEKAAKKAEAHERMLRNTGGLLEREGDGRVVIVNGQSKFAMEVITNRIAAIDKVIRVKMDYVECEKCRKDGFDVVNAKVPADAQLAVFVVNDAKLPMSLVAVEAGWGMVNVAMLDNEKRFNKELSRVMVLTFGAALSTTNMKSSPMQTVKSPEDLDALVGENITPDAFPSILRNFKNRGVTQVRRCTYKRACEEGWASEPTNEYQKVIWEKVKAEQNEAPSNPIKIEFDAEKGE